MSILIIPDSHAKTAAGVRRYKALGKLIQEFKPHSIVQLGDWADMESLSSYDKGKKSFEGRRYKKDIEAANAALEAMEDQIKYSVPNKIWLWGNHEHRIDRAMNDSPELEGLLDKDHILAKKAGWKTFEFGERVTHRGYTFNHYFTSGVMGRPVSGDNHARRLLQTQHTSCIQGHSHLWHYAEATRGDNRKIQAIVAGSYLDPNQREAYAGQAQALWWNGITILHDAGNGWSDHIERIGINQILKRYL